MFFASDFNHAFVYHALVARVHALIDLIDDAEWCAGHGLKGHEIEDGRDGTFASGLALCVENL